MIGKKSIQYINGAEGRRRHTAYSKCYTPQAMGQYFDNLNKVLNMEQCKIIRSLVIYSTAIINNPLYHMC